jgi:hypothetical protein
MEVIRSHHLSFDLFCTITGEINGLERKLATVAQESQKAAKHTHMVLSGHLKDVEDLATDRFVRLKEKSRWPEHVQHAPIELHATTVKSPNIVPWLAPILKSKFADVAKALTTLKTRLATWPQTASFTSDRRLITSVPVKKKSICEYEDKKEIGKFILLSFNPNTALIIK